MTSSFKWAARELVKDSLSLVRRPVTSRRFRTAVAVRQGRVKVNVGGAGRPIPGWINTDVSWRADHYLDLGSAWPVAPGSVDLVYGDNVIEHLPLRTGRRAMAHIFEALRPGGWLRLATPDAERTARAYLDDPALASAHLERHRRAGYDVAHPVDLLRVTFSEAGHHLGYIYDFDCLQKELRAAGFDQVHRREAGESEHPELRDLESRAEASEIATELVVDARKPPAAG